MVKRTMWHTSAKKRTKKAKKTYDIPITEEYEILYADLKALGKTEEEIITILEKVKADELAWKALEDDSDMDNKGIPTDKYKGIKLRLQYSLDDIKGICKWDEMSLQEQEEVLWSLGIDTKKYHFYVETRQHTRLSGKPHYGEIVYGNERVDSRWVNMLDATGCNVASIEAHTWYGDLDLEHQSSTWEQTTDKIEANKDEYERRGV